MFIQGYWVHSAGLHQDLKSFISVLFTRFSDHLSGCVKQKQLLGILLFFTFHTHTVAIRSCGIIHWMFLIVRMLVESDNPVTYVQHEAFMIVYIDLFSRWHCLDCWLCRTAILIFLETPNAQYTMKPCANAAFQCLHFWPNSRPTWWGQRLLACEVQLALAGGFQILNKSSDMSLTGMHHPYLCCSTPWWLWILRFCIWSQGRMRHAWSSLCCSAYIWNTIRLCSTVFITPRGLLDTSEDSM